MQQRIRPRSRPFGVPTDWGAAVRLAAHLGGYRDRRHDPYPGHQVTWHGDSTLASATLGHQAAIGGVRLRGLQDQQQDRVLHVLRLHG